MLKLEDRVDSKKKLKEWIVLETKSYGHLGIVDRILLVSEKSVLRKHILLLRKTEYYTNRKKLLRIFYGFRLRKIQNKYAIHVPINVCAKGLYIVHIGPILINKNSVVGENCTIHINTGIVAGGPNSDAPVIGDHVILGIGSVVLGKTRVGNYVAIGANSCVNRDVLDDHVTVAGCPARIVSRHGSERWG